MPLLPTTVVLESDQAQYELNEIANLKVIIHAYNTAILALTLGTHQSYQLDTGQTSQRVTRLDLSSLIETRKLLVDELETRQAAAGLLRSVVTVIPEW